MFSPPHSSPTLAPWEWRLDESVLRDDGGLAGDDSLALTVDTGIARQYMYTPPNGDYQRVLWEASKESLLTIGTPPANPASSAGWAFASTRTTTAPIFVAHSMLAAVWLLRQSLPTHSVSDSVWQHLTAATSSTPLPSAPPISSSVVVLDTLKRTALEANNKNGGNMDEDAPSTLCKRARITRSSTNSTTTPAVITAITTVSHHNRRAIRQREAKAVEAAQRRQKDLGLVPPDPRAPVAEHAAHRAITPVDEPSMAWIFKYPIGKEADFYTTARTPYTTATAMITKARALGNPTALAHARIFLQSWRACGTPLPGSSSSTPLSSSLLQGTGQLVRQVGGTQDARLGPPSFGHLWHLLTRCEDYLGAAHVQYRWGMAFLAQRYAQEIARLQKGDRLEGPQRSCNRGGRGKV